MPIVCNLVSPHSRISDHLATYRLQYLENFGPLNCPRYGLQKVSEYAGTRRKIGGGNTVTGLAALGEYH
ncbi:hypothetical protein EAF00_006565 [Botryotinia globosa]|nr:hypothetical protein EAF00_006565 [Botryotinia globosa]